MSFQFEESYFHPYFLLNEQSLLWLSQLLGSNLKHIM
uniref:Uncharacterized protein n=1 Tax=Manihot esculenta TaxID=3983 RepID=A0A2C9W3R8_MANES